MIAKEITYSQIFRAYARKIKRVMLNLYKPYQWGFIVIMVIVPFTSLHGSKFNPISALLILVLFEIFIGMERGEKKVRK